MCLVHICSQFIYLSIKFVIKITRVMRVTAKLCTYVTRIQLNLQLNLHFSLFVLAIPFRLI